MTVHCDFERDGSAAVRCVRCRRRVLTGLPPDRVFRQCKARCRHLGAIVPPVLTDCACQDRTEAWSTAAECAVRGRCLPLYRPTPEVLERWQQRQPEAGIYALCRGCPEYQPAEAGQR